MQRKSEVGLSFVFKAQMDGLGTIVWANLKRGKSIVWREAVFLPYAGGEVMEAFRRLHGEVWPDRRPFAPHPERFWRHNA